MIDSMLRSLSNRPLLIDFNLHTDGDEAFKQELIHLIIDNIWELQQVQRSNDHSLFLRVCHKVKSTLSMLNDNDLNSVVKELSDPNLDRNEKKMWVTLFHRLCEEIIMALEKERH